MELSKPIKKNIHNLWNESIREIAGEYFEEAQNAETVYIQNMFTFYKVFYKEHCCSFSHIKKATYCYNCGKKLKIIIDYDGYSFSETLEAVKILTKNRKINISERKIKEKIFKRLFISIEYDKKDEC